MNIRQFFSSLLIAMICLPYVTGMAIAQQPGESSLEDAVVQDAPGTDEATQEPLLVRPPQDDTPRRPFETAEDIYDPQNQEMLVNTRYAGWEEISDAATGRRTSDTIRGNWIMIDDIGRFDGRVTAGEGAEVADMNIFLMNKGRLVKQTRVNDNGSFEFTNVRQGAYSMIGWGPNGFFAFGLNILGYNPQNTGVVVNSVFPTAYQNQTTINTDWIKYYAPQVAFRVYGRYPAGEGRDDPAALYGFEGLVENMPESTLATSISGQRVVKTAAGGILGRVHQLNSISGRPVDVHSTRIMLFQGDGVVASTTIDNYGGFAFQQVPDGSYGLTAVGSDGVGMISINVVSGNSTVGESNATPIDFTLISSETIGWLNNYATEVAYRRILLAPRPPSLEDGNGYGCPSCGNQPGGCNVCQAAYAKSNCKSRGITFEQWAQSGCQCDAQKFGDGSILAAFAKQIRKNVEKSDAILDKAFYPEINIDGLSANPGFQNPAPAIPNQAYPYQPNGN